MLNWFRLHWVYVVAGVISAGIVGWLIGRAYYEPPDDEFWTVAIPGLLTGVGTLALAAATVMLSVRTQQREAKARDDEQRKDSFRVVSQPGTKVEPISGGNLPVNHVCVISVLNGSSSPILNVRLKTASCINSTYGEVEFVKDDPSPYAWLRQVLLPHEQHDFAGRWIGYQGQVVNADQYLREGAAGIAIIFWTDAHDANWRRTGLNTPIRL